MGIFALALIVSALLLFTGTLRGASAEDGMDVFIAKIDIEAGMKITADNTTKVRGTGEAVSNAFFFKEGFAAAEKISKGDIILSSDIIKEEEFYSLSEGEKHITLLLRRENVGNGDIKPGDLVQVLLVPFNEETAPIKIEGAVVMAVDIIGSGGEVFYITLKLGEADRDVIVEHRNKAYIEIS